jgi:hypothetical protein
MIIPRRDVHLLVDRINKYTKWALPMEVDSIHPLEITVNQTLSYIRAATVKGCPFCELLQTYLQPPASG